MTRVRTARVKEGAGRGRRGVTISVAALLVGVPLSAVGQQSASGTTPESVTGQATPGGADCAIETEKKVVELDRDHYRQRIGCASLPAGVQAGWNSSDRSLWTPSLEADGAVVSDWAHWVHSTGLRTTIEYRADPSGAGSACRAEMVKMRDVPFDYDEHAVVLSCNRIADAVKARGVGEYVHQSATYTGWLSYPSQSQSESKKRTVPAMPNARIEYELR